MILQLTKKSASALGVMALAGSLLTACVGKPASEYEAQPTQECPVASTDAAGTFRLGYQVIAGSELYLRDKSLVEACMPNVDVQWTSFPSGQDVVQGFASDSVDMGFLGSTPSAKALSKPLDLDVEVTSVNAVIGSSEALVAKDAKSIEELKGKTIATAFSSTSHFSLLNALIKAGLDPKRDVNIVNISPDKLPAAWRDSEIDAAYIWDPTLAEIKKDGHVLIDSSQVAKQGAPTYNLELTSTKWAKSNEELIRTWEQLRAWATKKSVDDPEDFVRANSIQVEQSPEDTKSMLDGLQLVQSDEQKKYLEQSRGVLVDTANFLKEQNEVDAPLDKAKAQTGVTLDYVPKPEK